MVRFVLPGLVIASLLVAPACKQKRKRAVPEPLADEPMLASFINVGDPHSAQQLSDGFYDIEAGAWRWTKKDFSVKLGRPRSAAQNGARLILRFALPDAIIQHLKSISLSAVINGFNLPAERYDKPGDFTYARDVPADKLTGDTLPVEFHLDKALPPGQVDSRQLGIIVRSVGFEIK